MSFRVLIITATLMFLGSFQAMATTQVISNGSFEVGGLTGWTVGQPAGNANVTACSFNAGAAPLTETASGAPTTFAATNGTNVAVGTLQDTVGGPINSCVLYQDVAIPAGATTATLSADLGIQYAGGFLPGNEAYQIGIFSTAAIPGWGADVLGNSFQTMPGASNPALVPQSHVVNVSTLAGTTVRVAIINAINTNNAGFPLLGIDNVSLQVTTPAPAQTPTMSEWGMILFMLLAGGMSVYFLKRQQGGAAA